MKALIAIVLIAGAAMGGWKIYSTWLQVNEKEKKTQTEQVFVSGADLPGMVPQLEPFLTAAQQKGASGLRSFLTQYGKTIADPRLASIELDYVVLVAKNDTAEARKAFARVKKRVPRDSPVYARIKMLEKTYE